MSSKSEIVIQSIRDGNNQKALKYLYKDPLRKIRKFILSNSGTIEDADDVFQDAIITLFDYVKTGRYDEAYDLDGFLYRVAKNSWIDKIRKNKKMIKKELIAFDLDDGNPDSLIELIKAEKLATFYELFNQLEESCRKILSFKIFEEKSMKEIATLMNYKDEKVAKNQHYRCKKYFSKIIYDSGEALKILRD